VNCDAN